MAYKFQLGKAVLSGSVKAEEGFDANSQEVSNFATISNGGSQIEIVEDTKVGGELQVSASSGQHKLQFGGSQQEIANIADNLELRTGGTTRLEVQDSLITAQQDLRVSASNGQHKLELGSSNYGISNLSNTLELRVNGATSLEVHSSRIDAKQDLQISASGGQHKLQFGGNQQEIRDLAGTLEFVQNGTKRMEIKSSGVDFLVDMSGSGDLQLGGNITLGGNLTVQGTTTTVNSTQLTVDDVKITLADGAGSLADGQGFEVGNDLASFVVGTVDSAQDSFVSSLALSASTVYATSFTGDGSGLTGISATDAIVSTTNVNTTNFSVDAAGAYFLNSGSAARTLDLDGPWLDGEIVYIKADNAETHNVTIRRSGSATIDGNLTEVVLESDKAAVTLIRNNSNWFIF